MNPASERGAGPDDDMVGAARSGADGGEGGTVGELRKNPLKFSNGDHGNAGAMPRLQRKLTRFDSLDVEAMRVRGVDARRKEVCHYLLMLSGSFMTLVKFLTSATSQCLSAYSARK